MGQLFANSQVRNLGKLNDDDEKEEDDEDEDDEDDDENDDENDDEELVKLATLEKSISGNSPFFVIICLMLMTI